MITKAIYRHKMWLLLALGMNIFSDSYAQSLRDSLRTKLTDREDSNTVTLYYSYGETFEQQNPDSAAFYYNKAKAMSKKIGYQKGIATYASYQIVLLNNNGKFREALDLALEALELYKKHGSKKDLAIAYLNVGSEWEYLSDFSTAAEYYLRSKKIAEDINDDRMQRITNNNLASIFINLKQYKKGFDYAKKSYSIATRMNDKYSQSSSLYNMGTAYIHLKEFDRALTTFEEIGKIGKEINDVVVIADGWLGRADAYNRQQHYVLAKKYYDTVLRFAKANGLPVYQLYANMGMGESMVKSHSYHEAGTYLRNGIDIATAFGATNELSHLYEKTSEMYEGLESWKESLKYRKIHEKLNDSLLSEKNKITIANLEAKYEFNKKESTIRLQAATIRQKNMLNYILIGGAAALLIISTLSYRNYKHRQKLQQQRINELETEKQLTATEAILKGEEQERGRLAKDLHDGLGGMLSGIKYSLNNMKENLIMTPGNAQAFEHSINMLDNSISEMRRVAHNLMPEALLKFGLDDALKDFCNELSRSGMIKIVYQSLGLTNKSIDQSLSVTIYRVIQELLNNIVKHADARQAIVQLSAENSQLTLTVEDDGKGMDKNLVKNAHGIGWKNITSRVQYHKGTIHVQSEPGKGTSVFIEFPTA